MVTLLMISTVERDGVGGAGAGPRKAGGRSAGYGSRHAPNGGGGDQGASSRGESHRSCCLIAAQCAGWGHAEPPPWRCFSRKDNVSCVNCGGVALFPPAGRAGTSAARGWEAARGSARGGRGSAPAAAIGVCRAACSRIIAARGATGLPTTLSGLSQLRAPACTSPAASCDVSPTLRPPPHLGPGPHQLASCLVFSRRPSLLRLRLFAHRHAWAPTITKFKIPKVDARTCVCVCSFPLLFRHVCVQLLMCRSHTFQGLFTAGVAASGRPMHC